MAVALAKSYPEFIAIESLALYERMIREGAWWDFVDDISANLIGTVLYKSPETMFGILDKWNRDEHAWIRRTSILC